MNELVGLEEPTRGPGGALPNADLLITVAPQGEAGGEYLWSAGLVERAPRGQFGIGGVAQGGVGGNVVSLIVASSFPGTGARWDRGRDG